MNDYKVELCARLISHAVFSGEKTKNLTFEEIKTHLMIFFSEEEINSARNYLTDFPKIRYGSNGLGIVYKDRSIVVAGKIAQFAEFNRALTADEIDNILDKHKDNTTLISWD